MIEEEKIYKYLKESVSQLEDVDLVIDIINSILNNNEWHTQNKTFSYSENNGNINKFIANQIKPYTWDKVKKQELYSFIVKLINSINNKELKLFLSVVKNNKQNVTNYYDITQLANMKQMIENEVKRILFGVASIPKSLKELNDNWKINQTPIIKK